MDDGALNAEVAQNHALTDHRGNAHANHNTIGMKERQFPWRFPAANGQVTGLELQLGKIPMESAEFDPSPSRTLQMHNHVSAHLRLEARAAEIPAGGHKKHQR